MYAVGQIETGRIWPRMFARFDAGDGTVAGWEYDDGGGTPTLFATSGEAIRAMRRAASDGHSGLVVVEYDESYLVGYHEPDGISA